MKAIYVGRRVTTKQKFAYTWKFEGEDTERLYSKQLAPSVIGECWTFVADKEGRIILGGTSKPVRGEMHTDAKDITKWEAETVAGEARMAEFKSKKILESRQSQFDMAVRPLKMMLDSLHFHDDRAYFVQRVLAELWRR